MSTIWMKQDIDIVKELSKPILVISPSFFTSCLCLTGCLFEKQKLEGCNICPADRNVLGLDHSLALKEGYTSLGKIQGKIRPECEFFDKNPYSRMQQAIDVEYLKHLQDQYRKQTGEDNENLGVFWNHLLSYPAEQFSRKYIFFYKGKWTSMFELKAYEKSSNIVH